MKKKINIQELFDNIKFRNKILLVALIVAVILSTASVIASQYVAKTYNSLLYNQTARSLSYFSDELVSNMEIIANLSQNIAVDSVIQESLFLVDQAGLDSWDYNYALSNIRRVLYRRISPNIINIAIFPNAGKEIVWRTDSEIASEEILQKAQEICDYNNGNVAWFSTGKNDNSILCMRQVRQIKNLSLKKLGYVVIRVNLHKIIENIVSSKYEDTSPYFINIRSHIQLIYSRDEDSAALNELSYKYLNGKREKYTIEKINNQRMFIVHTPVLPETLDWVMTLGVSYDVVFHSIIFSNTIYIIIILLALILTMLLSEFLVKNITYHFNTLISKMERLKAGNFEIMKTKRRVGNDELGLLNKYFDEMTVEFKKMIDDNYVKQLLIAQAQLKSLEQQINPHFLYNTLESIYWFAKRSGEKNITTMVEGLSILLRNNLSEQEDVIPLEKELLIVKSYIQIQQIRYSDSLTIEFDVDSDIMDVTCH